MQLDGEGVDEGEGVCSNKKWQCVYFSVEFSLGKSQIDPPHFQDALLRLSFKLKAHL